MDLKPGLYQNYKGGYYWVQGQGRDSDNLKEVVIYRALYENEFGRNAYWTRALKLFLKPSKDGKQRYRYIGPYPQATEGLTGILLPETD